MSFSRLIKTRCFDRPPLTQEQTTTQKARSLLGGHDYSFWRSSLYLTPSSSLTDYLLEDPVSDVNLQIHGQATETAHAYANMLHRGGCQIEVGILPADWSGAYNAEMIGYAWRTRDGVRPDYDSESDMGPSCPPQYVSSLHRRETGASGTPFRIIPAARLDLLPQRLNDTHTGIKYGSKTSDLAMVRPLVCL